MIDVGESSWKQGELLQHGSLAANPIILHDHISHVEKLKIGQLVNLPPKE